MVANLCTLSK